MQCFPHTHTHTHVFIFTQTFIKPSTEICFYGNLNKQLQACKYTQIHTNRAKVNSTTDYHRPQPTTTYLQNLMQTLQRHIPKNTIPKQKTVVSFLKNPHREIKKKIKSSKNKNQTHTHKKRYINRFHFVL